MLSNQNIEIIKQTVDAKVRRLSARWDWYSSTSMKVAPMSSIDRIEDTGDLTQLASDNPDFREEFATVESSGDIQEELMNELSSQIAAEIDKELLDSFKYSATGFQDNKILKMAVRYDDTEFELKYRHPTYDPKNFAFVDRERIGRSPTYDRSRGLYIFNELKKPVIGL